MASAPLGDPVISPNMSEEPKDISSSDLPENEISKSNAEPPTSSSLPLSETHDLENQERLVPARKKPKESSFVGLGWLDRFLALWIFLAMAVGILLGNFVPNTGHALQKGQFVGVSVPIAVGLLVMMYPILCKIKFEALHKVFGRKDVWVQIAFSIFMNWIVAPLLMLGLAWAFLPDERGLRDGLILVGIARCIAMVLIWTGLAGGDSEYCAILVAINSVLQMALFAPLSVLFLSVISDRDVDDISYKVVAKSVAVFLGIPLGAAMATRFTLRNLFRAPKFYDQIFLTFVAPWSLLGLLFTILILFASQGERVVHQIVSVLRVAAPLILYFATLFSLTLVVTYKLGFGYKLAATQSFTAASNNFELAIAVAIATFGPDSDQALAIRFVLRESIKHSEPSHAISTVLRFAVLVLVTVTEYFTGTVGPLIEVPVLLGLVYVARWVGKSKAWKD